MQLQGSSSWVMDSGASSHMHSSDVILLSRSPASHVSMSVGNSSHIPVTSRGHSILPLLHQTLPLIMLSLFLLSSAIFCLFVNSLVTTTA